MSVSALALICSCSFAFAGFLIPPYLQSPAPTSMTMIWFSSEGKAGEVKYWENPSSIKVLRSSPSKSVAHSYTDWESATFFGGKKISAPYKHRVKIDNLKPGTEYRYEVVQGAATFQAKFRTSPTGAESIRFVVYSDCETEPESAGAFVKWPPSAAGKSDRQYLIDQTLGYANNLQVIFSRQPNFIALAGDLVESGGEQRDWDEFWRHATSLLGAQSLASNIPILPAPGNHEYYAGPKQGEYRQPFSEAAIAKYLGYFDVPDNGAKRSLRGRYYRLDFGPVTLISLDTTNGTPAKSENDTNFFLAGEGEDNGGHSPGFLPGTDQYKWLEEQLRDAQKKSNFTFVLFHHAPYTTYHTQQPGEGAGQDTQSGVPVRALTPLFIRYGVDSVFAGHGEMLTRAEVEGDEIRSDGTSRKHAVHFYDVGIGGDGLRDPNEPKKHYPFLKYSAHFDSEEKWSGNHLVDGGKHYGHIEVNITHTDQGGWEATMTPVYVFPLFSSDGRTCLGFERRTYNDVVHFRATE